MSNSCTSRALRAALAACFTVLATLPVHGAGLRSAPADVDRSVEGRARAQPTAYLIELTEPAGVVAYAAALAGRAPGASTAATDAATSQIARNRTQQDVLVAALPDVAPGARILYRVQRAVNGVAVRVPPSQVAALGRLPNVKAVHPILPSYPNNAYSVPDIGAPKVWVGSSGLPAEFRGEGMRIGIIDTGIDYLHAGFGSIDSSLSTYQTDATKTASFTTLGGAYPTPKVVGGWDFVGDAYNADVGTLPVPDPNPMDCGGHGSHVAGTAAGVGVNDNGTPYVGPLVDFLPFETLRVGPGVAPRALLYALRVFGCVGSTDMTVAAIDWAIDPNGDGDFSDRLDVINLSLGSPYGRLSDDSAIAANNAALAGVITVISAGNSGDAYTVVGSPGAAERAVTVANSSSFHKGVVLNVDAPAAIAGLKTSVLAGWSIDRDWPLGVPNEVAKFSSTDVACNASGAYPPGFFTGKYALVNRGTCTFAEKYTKVVAAGAAGVIVANNSAAAPIVMGGTPTGPTTAPAIMITQADGTAIKAQLDLPATVTVSFALGVQSLGGGLNASSSRGPTGDGSIIVAKPDLTAPGTNIVSVQTGVTCKTGACQRPDPSGYVPDSQKLTLSGTSMAAPHIAGLMTLLRQAHPTYTVEQLKALAVNGALKNVFVNDGGTGARFGPARAGAGGTDALQAATLAVAAYGTADPGAVSVTFDGEIVGTLTQTRRVTVRNFGTSDQTFDLGIELLTDAAGVSFTFPAPTVTIAAGSTASFDVQMTADATQMKRSRDGTVPATVGGFPREWLTEESGVITLSQVGVAKLRVPVYAAVHPAATTTASALQLVGPGTPGAAQIQLGGTGVCTGTLAGPTCTATASDFVSLVTPLELHGVNPVNPAIHPRANLRYAGVVFDAAAQALKFGVATWGDHTSPRDLQVAIYVDVNGDGSDDHVLFNTALTASPDTFVTAVQPLPAGAATAQDFVNWLGSATADTGIYVNNLMVLPLYPADIGMSATAPTFKYRVEACDRLGPCESIGPFTYTGAGYALPAGPLPGLPGASLPVTINGGAVTANGSKGVLLLFHHNVEGQRTAVATLTGTGPVTMTLATSNPSVPAGQTVTLTATVTGFVPSGTVVFRNGPEVIAGCAAVPLVTTGNTATATCTTAALTMGSYTFLASYAGDAFNAAASASVAQTATPVAGQPCAGFTDIDATDPLCSAVDWIRNRAITLGCAPNQYCPNQALTRLEMAALVNRLGTRLTPVPRGTEAVPGALVLDGTPVVCTTGDVVVAGYPRRFQVTGVFTATAASTVDIAADPVVSFDGGISWERIGSTGNRGTVPAGRWANLWSIATQDANVGQTARFGLAVGRDGQPGTANLTASRCNLHVLENHRTGTFSPFDAIR